MAQSTDYLVQLVDDHHMMRMGLRAIASSSARLALRWIENSNLGDALDAYAAQPQVDLVLLDLNLPDSQGLQGVRRFLREFPQARLAVFSGTQDEFVVGQAMALGAVGFVPKSASAEATLSLIESLLEAGRACASTLPMGIYAYDNSAWPAPHTGPSGLTASAAGHPPARDRAAALNPTQLKVLELVLAGLSNQEIANECKLALGTVKNTVSSIMLSLDVHSRSHLISVFR